MFHSVRSRIVTLFLAVMAIIVIVAAVVAFGTIHESEHQITDRMGHDAAHECATMLEGIAPKDGKIDPNSNQYDAYRRMLRSLCMDTSMDYLYVYRRDVKNQTATYLLAAAGDTEKEKTISEIISYGTVVHAETSDVERAALEGEDSYTAIEYDNVLGHQLDWVCRVEGWGDNVLVGASYSVSEQRDRVYKSTLRIVLAIALPLFILLLVELLMLRFHVFKPLRTISDRMRGFSAGHADDFKPLSVDSRDELGDIAEAFNGMSADIITYVNDIERMTKERVQVDVEMDVARRIQLGMVPEHAHLESGMCDASAFSRPARAVGGDFYDLFKLEDGRIAAVIGDASGKGVAAALFMAMTKTMVHDSLLAGNGPVSALRQVNARLCDANPEGMFITVFVCVLDPSTGEVRFANAGHMPPIVIGDDVSALEVDPGDLIGLFDDAAMVEDSVLLAPGESLLLYTDGAVEARELDGAFFGEERFLARLRDCAPYAGSDQLVETAARVVEEYVAGCEQFDDLTAVALFRAAEPKAIPVEMESFAKVRTAILAMGCDDALKRKACLAAEEAFANIVSYSGANSAWFAVEVDGDALRITLKDDGVPFDPATAPLLEKDFADLDAGGMGIGLIRQLAELDYERVDNRNVLTLIVSGT